MARRAWRQWGLSSLGGSRGLRRSQWLRSLTSLSVLLLIALSLADPRWGHTTQTVPQPDTQIVFLLDVSRSMLAEDVQPSRLERAKQYVSDVLSSLHGEAVALVAFDGATREVVPLTRDYHAFEHELRGLQPSTGQTAGTRLDVGLFAAGEEFVTSLPGEKVLVVLTDGEDHGADATAVSKTLQTDDNIHVVCVGFGDAEIGARIPLTDAQGESGYLRHNGEVVWTRAVPSLLREMAQQGDGAFLVFAGNDESAASSLFVPALYQIDAESTRLELVTIPRFQWFLGLAVVLLLTDTIFLSRGKPADTARHRPPARSPNQHAQHRRRSLVTAAFVAVVGLVTTAATSPQQLFNDAQDSVAAGRWEEALERYRQAAALLPDRAEPSFNLGVVLYRRGDWEAATRQFDKVLESHDRHLDAEAHYNRGNCRYARVLAGGLTCDDSIAILRHAIEDYRAALELRPKWDAPRTNIQLAYMLIRHFERQQSAGECAGEKRDETPAEGSPPKAEAEAARSDTGDESDQSRSPKSPGTQHDDPKQRKDRPEDSDWSDPETAGNRGGTEGSNGSRSSRSPDPAGAGGTDQASSQQTRAAESSTEERQNSTKASASSRSQGEDKQRDMTRDDAERLLAEVRQRDAERRRIEPDAEPNNAANSSEQKGW